MFDIFLSLFTIQNIIFMFVGITIGILFGSVPGLTTVLAIVLFTPMTYGMDAVPALLLLLGLYCGGTYGGSITAILINTPGTPAASATAIDGYPLAKKGMAKKALEIALYASVIAGLFSGIILLVGAPTIASIAITFGAPEYFMLSIFGLTIIISISSENVLSGVLAGCTGIFLAMIGTDSTTGVSRYVFGNINLGSGLDLLLIMIGMFAVFELMEKVTNIVKDKEVQEFKADTIKVSRKEKGLTLKELLGSLKTIIRGALIGVGIGSLPGTGAALASFISYNQAKKSSKRSKYFGKGELEGVAATESGNNGVTGATLIPLLTLGIPGDIAVAILLGTLILHGLTPGPQLFTHNSTVVYAVMFGFILLQIVLLIVGRLVLRFAYKVAYISNVLLVPIVLLFCTAGAYAVRNKVFDIFVIPVFALLAFVFKKIKIPTLPLILGFILGSMAETFFRRSLAMSFNGALIFITRPFCIAFWVLIVLSLFSYYFRRRKNRQKIKESAAVAEE